MTDGMIDTFSKLQTHLRALSHDELVSLCIGAMSIAVLHPEDFDGNVAREVEAVAAVFDLMERQQD